MSFNIRKNNQKIQSYNILLTCIFLSRFYADCQGLENETKRERVAKNLHV